VTFWESASRNARVPSGQSDSCQVFPPEVDIKNAHIGNRTSAWNLAIWSFNKKLGSRRQKITGYGSEAVRPSYTS